MVIANTSMLITGGTGSLGRKLAELLLAHAAPRRVVIFSRDELKQSEMQRQPLFQDERVRFFIGDIRDGDRLRRAMEDVDIVVHAAALKQVPICEYNPFEAIRTNVLGAQNVIEAALDLCVPRVLCLSTDKAVNPANLYGATKLCAEKLFTAANAYVGRKAMKISCVRYGNVVGSRGSVVPLFLEQRRSGTITLTSEDMTRFWITLPQAAQFVMDSIERMRGGEIFIPRLPSTTIQALADAIAPGCRRTIIGARPGEKRHEVLLVEHEARIARELEGFYVVEPQYPGIAERRWTEGQDVPDGFAYSSATNSWRLTEREIRAYVQEIEEGTDVPAVSVA